MREWLLALVPLALVVYFVLRPDHFALVASEAAGFLH
jgi:hypothetical protein